MLLLIAFLGTIVGVLILIVVLIIVQRSRNREKDMLQKNYQKLSIQVKKILQINTDFLNLLTQFF